LARSIVHFGVVVITIAGFCAAGGRSCFAQEELIERTGPPALDNLEADANQDGVPDGWYNACDATWMAEGGAPSVGPHFVRLECKTPGRPARLSRAFGIDGTKTSAIRLGLWIRLSNIQYGEREGSEPSMLIDFLGAGLRALGRGTLGPWTHSVHGRWTRVVKQIAVPPGTKDAIMSVGLMGATGVLDIDGLTVELVPLGGEPTTNLVVNGGFELGDPAPFCWNIERNVHRVFPGFNSSAAVELQQSKSKLLTGLATEIDRFDTLEVSVSARCSGLRGAGGVIATLYFLDDNGQQVAGHEAGDRFMTWSDTSPWRVDNARVSVPRGARRAVLQFDKLDAIGSIRIDDVQVTGLGGTNLNAWTPFQVADDTEGWLAVPVSRTIIPKSALDVSFLLPAPAGAKGAVIKREGQLAFKDGGRARFFGVSLLPPTAFLDAEPAEKLADRLARSGINLVRLGDLDAALGPDLSLFDDTRDDTRDFDPVALGRLDHLIAALKRRGIYVALELQSKRRFRTEDGVAFAGQLPYGGGPAALFDPTITKLQIDAARSLLAHVNPETKLALRDDPALAWVTLLGETSLFDLPDKPESLPLAYAKTLHELAEKVKMAPGPRFWEAVEGAHSRKLAEELRKDGLRAPLAGVSHWRRDPTDFCDAQAVPELDLIDDRIFWNPFLWAAPERQSLVWLDPKNLAKMAAVKRRADRPYVLGMWCNQTSGAWSFPCEAADQIFTAYTASTANWDGIVRRGIFIYPKTWGEGPAGTAGEGDIYQVPEVANASPHVYALWPHAASLFLRGSNTKSASASRRARTTSGWSAGRLIVDNGFTQGVAGWWGGHPAAFSTLEVATDSPFAVVMATSIGDEPIASSKRLLITAIARVEPTGFRWVNHWKREVAGQGRPPFLQEPVMARVLWRRKGTVRAFALDNDGKRLNPAPLEGVQGGEGVILSIDGKTPAFHWELVVE
jgi:hypothetical protein